MQKLFESRAFSFDHAVCDAIIPWRLIKVKFVDCCVEFLWFYVLVEKRTDLEDQMLHFVKRLLFIGCYLMSGNLIIRRIFVFEKVVPKDIPEPMPSLSAKNGRAQFLA